LASPELASRIDALGAGELQGVFYRHVAVRRDPRSGLGARINGGRWNPPESFSTLYLADSVETVAREFLRIARRQGVRPEDFLPRDLYTFEVQLEAVVDLRTPEARRRVGLSDAELRSDDPRACRAIGEAAHDLDFEGVTAPSATGSGEVLAVFLERLRRSSRVEPTARELWESPPLARESEDT
jgi:RES domain-containing protein